MNILLLGHGKTGSVVAEVARQRRHQVRVLSGKENVHARALTRDKLRDVEIVLDFTTPNAVLENIEACVASRKTMLVGTTGWHSALPKVRELVEAAGTGFLYGANFSIGVNIFLETARAAAAALQQGYFGQIMERHHAAKKDAPSGTAVVLQQLMSEVGGAELEITSFREGDAAGLHEIILDSPNDTIRLEHDAKSRQGFAEGAIRAAEWLVGKSGFFDFKDVWRVL